MEDAKRSLSIRLYLIILSYPIFTAVVFLSHYNQVLQLAEGVELEPLFWQTAAIYGTGTVFYILFSLLVVKQSIILPLSLFQSCIYISIGNLF